MQDEHGDPQECNVLVEPNQNVEAERALQPLETAGKQNLEADYRQTDKGKVLTELIEKTTSVSGIDNGRKYKGKGDEDYVDYDQSDGFLHDFILVYLSEKSRWIID
jgi:hypothetical protein